MESRVYRYRSRTRFFLIAFLTIWCGGWDYGLLSPASQPSLQRSGAMIPAVIGLAITGLLLLLILHTVNCRIEIGDDRIRWFDFLGRVAVDAPFEDAQLVGNYATTSSSYKRVIKTSAGKVKFSSDLADYGDLIQQFRVRADAVEVASGGAEPIPLTPFQPITAIYPPSALFMMCGPFAIMVIVVLVAMQMPMKVAWVAIVPTSLCVVCTALLGRNAKIVLDTQGMQYTSWLGKTTFVQPNELIEVHVSASSKGPPSYNIVTTKGTFIVLSSMSNRVQLLEALREIITQSHPSVHGGITIKS
ncbi:MAG: hypothetical protein JSS72_09665 [Armatimonadetes bacterium]|nr:hypothetical protein [Armatimonadota bacterium]